jgi:DNA replication protein DnaC
MTTIKQMAMLKKALGYNVLDVPLEKNAHCETHGDYVSYCYYDDVYSGCEQCRKEKIEQSRKQQEELERQQKNMRWLARIGDAGIPERFKTRTLETYVVDANNTKQQRIYDFCKDYAASFDGVRKTGRSFLMLGTVGTGKTHLSIGIALEVMKSSHSAVFTSASKIFRSIKDTYQKGSHQKESEAMAVYTQCDLLIIDEVGVQRGSDFEKETFFDVINERYENMRPTIILSNLTIDEIKLFLGERVFDRLRENGGKAFLLDWPSHRAGAHYD